MIMKIVLIALAGMNLFSSLLMYLDKRRAQRDKWRISEKTLFLAAACFGALGGVLGMHLLHHKTRHWHFRVFFPLLLILQAVLLGLLFVRFV